MAGVSDISWNIIVLGTNPLCSYHYQRTTKSYVAVFITRAGGLHDNDKLFSFCSGYLWTGRNFRWLYFGLSRFPIRPKKMYVDVNGSGHLGLGLDCFSSKFAHDFVGQIFDWICSCWLFAIHTGKIQYLRRYMPPRHLHHLLTIFYHILYIIIYYLYICILTALLFAINIHKLLFIFG